MTITKTVTLYTLAELIDLGDQRAIDAAYSWLADVNLEFWDGNEELENYLVPDVLMAAGIVPERAKARNLRGEPIEGTYHATWCVNDRGEFFALNKCWVDTDRFLAAFKVWSSGQDIRGPQYAAARHPIKGPATNGYRLDLRTKDGRILREQGLVVDTSDRGWRIRRSDEFDFDYHYEGLSEGFKVAANEMLSDLMHHCLVTLNESYQDCWDQEGLRELAECNEYTFTAEGKRED